MARPRRSNPKIMHQAGELRKELTPAERKLWSYLRNNQLNCVSFRRQHAIGNYIPDFCAIKEKLIIELDGTPFGRNTLNRKNTTRKELNISNHKAIKSSAFGIIRS